MKNTYLNELSLTSICLFCENADENGIISINCTQCYPNKLKFVMGDNKWTKERAEMIVNRAKSSVSTSKVDEKFVNELKTTRNILDKLRKIQNECSDISCEDCSKKCEMKKIFKTEEEPTFQCWKCG